MSGKTNYVGIDYGLGLSNVDRETGIRFGVIPAHALGQSWYDSAEPDYGDPYCPKCGNEAQSGESKSSQHYDAEGNPNGVSCWTEHPPETEDYEVARGACGDYRCDDCRYLFDGDEAFGDEPLGYSLDDGEYKATQGSDDSDIFILKSPYYTYAQFCSPCAPGAGYLLNPCPTGPKTYCFGDDWFDAKYGTPCPYPVYRVADDTLVFSPSAAE